MIYLTFPALITPLGDSPELFFQALLEGRRGFTCPLHFESHGRRLGVCHQIDDHEEFDERYTEEERNSLPPRLPRAHRLLNALRAKLPDNLPQRLYLATTVGDIDLVTAGGVPEPDSPQSLLAYARKLFHAEEEALLVSSACASGQRAICLAADAVARGEIDSALVVGCDQTSEFVTSGFGSLSALTDDLPRPYDANRSGMTLGEAAAAVIVTAEKPASGLSARMAGYGESCDATHITAPDAQGTWLAEAIRKAMPEGLCPNAVIGHGTGTIYNDQAELAALQIAFPSHRLPLFSLKGNIGHTLGATGVLQVIAGMEILATRQFPPQAGLETPAQGAKNAVAATSRRLPADAHTVLSLNAGFGGLNNALLLTDLDIPLQGEGPIAKTLPRPELLDLECDTTCEERLGEERDALVARGVLSAENTADFRRASLAVKHAILAAAKLKERMGNAWHTEEITVIGYEGDGVRHSNPAYWKDYIDHGRRRGRGTLFVDTLASIPLCEVAIALQLHGPAGYLQGKSFDELFPPRQVGLTEPQMDCINDNRDLRLRTSKTRLTLLISAHAEFAAAFLFGIARL